jgi:anti-anti-sigma factor
MGSVMHRQGKTAVVEVHGKLTLGPSVDEFRACWSDALATGVKEIIVNLSDVPMVDSSGISSLIRCHSALGAQGGKLRVIGVSDVVRHALQVTRVDGILNVEDAPAEEAGGAAS